jgi:adenosylcobinamide-GDP ribazoletransferase
VPLEGQGASSAVPREAVPREAVPCEAAPRLGPPAWRGARAAFVFFSRVPVGGFPYDARDWHWAPAHLPLVGAVVGSACAVIFRCCAWLGFAPLITATAVLATSIALTGALHEDGLADSSDALGATRDRQRALEIMKDSRIGTYGALALVLSLLVRAAAVAELAPGAWFALVYVHVWARVSPTWLLWSEPYVNDRPDAKSQGLFETRPRHVATALGWGAAAAALGIGAGWLTPLAALGAALASLLTALLLARQFRSRIGGVTGDLLGAAEQVAEVACWLVLGSSLGR